MEYVYHARFEREADGGYLVSFPDVPEAVTFGADLEDARESAADALATALRGRADDGKPVPAPAARGDGLVAIVLPAETALKLAVIDAFRTAGITKTELARRLGKLETEGRRILDPNHATKTPALEAALAALGKAVIVSVRDAA